MVPRVGQRIGPYEILGRLGSGGMGLVFSAWDARLQRDVAIKLLREEFATPTMRSRFLQEARAASGLNHANICTVFDIGEVAGDPFLVMELLKGETLRSRIARQGSLPPEDIHRIASEVADALSVAHARGVIHRDIKPANIILVNKPGGGFQSKVLDFGLAKVELGDEESTRNDLTTIGTTVGTVSYMSPEQARGEAIDARSDLFSLGSVLYESATGELPFQGATSALIFVELLGKSPMPIRQNNPAMPKDMDRIITRLLSKPPADRFQSANSLLEALQGVSFRKSPLGGLSLWGPKPPAVKPRTDGFAVPSPPDSLGPDVSPAPDKTPARGLGDTGTFLRPARRTADPFAPRPLASPSPPSPVPTSERPAAPSPQEPAAKGAVVVRPIKPDALRPLGVRATGSSAESPLQLNGQEGSAANNDDLAPGLLPDSDDPLRSASSTPPGTASVASQTSAPAMMVVPRPISSLPDHPTPPGGIPIAEEPREERELVPPRTSRAIWIVAVLLLTAVLVFVWYFMVHRTTTATAGPTTIVLAATQDGTSDGSLGRTVAAGLKLAAEQSPHLAIRSAEHYLVGLRATGHAAGGDVSIEQARQAARTVGAEVLVFGGVHTDGSAYVLSVRLVNVATGGKAAEFSEAAASREQIAPALDRLATDLRSSLGETSDSIGRTTVPLSREATANADALESFAAGTNLEAAGNPDEARLAFRRALEFDSHFTQPQLRLAALYRERHAEIAAALAATQAQASSASASIRTQDLARASYAIHAEGDYGSAAHTLHHLLATYPNDVEALNNLALAQFLGGNFSDGQDTAERVLQLSRFDTDATAQDELALIAEGRPEAVSSVESAAQSAGVTHPGAVAQATAASLSTTEVLVPGDSPLPPTIAASLFDAAGHFGEGAARWQEMADNARASADLNSAAAYAAGTAALNRALAGECPAALVMAQQASASPAGPWATFSTGEAEALCGDADGARRSLFALNSSYTRGSAAQAYLVPDLAATIAWKAGDTPGALRLLDAARQFDSQSLTAYLRGLVEISAHQPQLSIVQFQTMLSHRGPATLFNPQTYPLAQLGLGRAYAASGDAANSSVAYGRFLDLWNTADPGLAAIAEARSHAHR